MFIIKGKKPTKTCYSISKTLVLYTVQHHQFNFAPIAIYLVMFVDAVGKAGKDDQHGGGHH
jgi:hypothetical protein